MLLRVSAIGDCAACWHPVLKVTGSYPEDAIICVGMRKSSFDRGLFQWSYFVDWNNSSFLDGFSLRSSRGKVIRVKQEVSGSIPIPNAIVYRTVKSVIELPFGDVSFGQLSLLHCLHLYCVWDIASFNSFVLIAIISKRNKDCFSRDEITQQHLGPKFDFTAGLVQRI